MLEMPLGKPGIIQREDGSLKSVDSVQEYDMFIRGETYNKWKATEKEEKCHTEEVENGCHIEVRTREADDGDIEMFISVYTATGDCAVERIKKLPGEEWTVEDALKRGLDQAERIAGGESGRLSCADAHGHDDE